MEALTTGSRRTRPTSLYVFLTLIVVVVTVALGAWLAGQPGPVGLPIADGEVVREDRLVATTTAADSSVAGWLDDGTNAAMAAPMEAARLLDAQVGAASPIVASEAESRVDDARIVRTANLELEVQDMAAALLSARSAIQGLGGYVSGSDAYDQGESRWASVTYRVPVAHFGEAVDALRGEADRVVREATQSIEVTGQVMDLDARIANLRASEAALVEIMDRAGRIEDVLAVQMRLEEVRGQIEQLEAQRAHLADQAALSTLGGELVHAGRRGGRGPGGLGPRQRGRCRPGADRRCPPGIGRPRHLVRRRRPAPRHPAAAGPAPAHPYHPTARSARPR